MAPHLGDWRPAEHFGNCSLKDGVLRSRETPTAGEGKWSIGRQLRRQSGDQDLWIGTLEVPEKTSCTRAPGSKGLGGPTVRKGSQHSGSCAKVGARCAGRPTRRAQSGERPPNRL